MVQLSRGASRGYSSVNPVFEHSAVGYLVVKTRLGVSGRSREHMTAISFTPFHKYHTLSTLELKIGYVFSDNTTSKTTYIPDAQETGIGWRTFQRIETVGR